MLAGMGTELQYSPNPFTTLPRSHGNTVTIAFDTQDTTRAPPKDRSLQQQQPMDRVRCHKDALRKTMLEHERVFKEQVRELHRLYRTQKLMMSQLQNKDLKLHPSSGSSGPQACSSPSTSNRHRHGPHMASDRKSHPGHRPMASLSSQELTVCSGELLRGQSSSELWPPSGEGDPAGVGDAQARDDNIFATHVETHPSCSDEECDLELTLSIGCGGGNKKRAEGRSRSDTPSGGFPESSANSTRRRTPSTPARSDPGQRVDAFVGPERESLKRPAWLFQGLSLNRT